MHKCALLAVGDELLDGRVRDTNSDFISERLESLGIEIILRMIVGDDPGHIGSALKLALELSGTVIITGGLGPTEDDLTREAVAAALGLSLKPDTVLEEELRKFFDSMGREMSATNLKQACLLEGAVPIAARLGTAPGQWLSTGEKSIFLVPGVPREMCDMIEGDVVPMLSRRLALANRRDTRRLVVAARPESELAEQVQAALSEIEGVGVSYRAMLGQIELKLKARESGAPLDEAEARIRSALGPWIVARGDETLEGNLGRELHSRALTLAVAESLTGGMVGERITRVPGCSRYFRGGIIAYTHEAKEAMLGVDGSFLRSRGAVCEEVAEAMASGVRERFSSHMGIALTGIAGPESGGELEPPGTVAFGLADESGEHSWKYRLPGDRGMVRQFATTVMLTIALLRVRGEDINDVR